MRITIEFDANELKQLQKITGQKKKSPASAQALTEYLRQRQKQQFLSRVLSGGADYAMTTDPLEAQDVYATR
ncbi:MAG: hypothetical protein KF791_19215 [Verrucomicrobiae bacterium]|nr:hypothetical protein [Verrucomicrobiae bacterium]